MKSDKLPHVMSHETIDVTWDVRMTTSLKRKTKTSGDIEVKRTRKSLVCYKNDTPTSPWAGLNCG